MTEIRTPIVRRLSDVNPEPVTWLWPGRFAIGKLSILAGDPGLGKSLCSMDLAARTSNGKEWPDGRQNDGAGDVLLLSAEDDAADTIRPRLDAAGADPARIVTLEAVAYGKEKRGVNLDADIEVVAAVLDTLERPRLVVIDPLSAYLGNVDSHKDAEVRGLMARLAALADASKVAIIGVMHLRKSSDKAIYATGGSIAFNAAARSVWGITRDKQDATNRRRLFIPIKNNLGCDTGGLAYTLESVDDSVPIVEWSNLPVEVDADEAMSSERNKRGPAATRRNSAADWLAEYLRRGPTLASEIAKAGDNAGFGERLLRRALKEIGGEAIREGFPAHTIWKLGEQSGQSVSSSEILSGLESPSGLSSLHFGPDECQQSGQIAAEDGRLSDVNGRTVIPIDEFRSLVREAKH